MVGMGEGTVTYIHILYISRFFLFVRAGSTFLGRVNIFLISNDVDLNWRKRLFAEGLTFRTYSTLIEGLFSCIIEIGYIPEMTGTTHTYTYIYTG